MDLDEFEPGQSQQLLPEDAYLANSIQAMASRPNGHWFPRPEVSLLNEI